MQRWTEEIDGLYLLTEDEYKQLPDGTKLECIDGTTYVKGTDEIDMDARFNHIAYGIRNPKDHELSELLTMFMLAGN